MALAQRPAEKQKISMSGLHGRWTTRTGTARGGKNAEEAKDHQLATKSKQRRRRRRSHTVCGKLEVEEANAAAAAASR